MSKEALVTQFACTKLPSTFHGAKKKRNELRNLFCSIHFKVAKHLIFKWSDYLWSQSFITYSSWKTCLAAFLWAKTVVLSCVPISIASLPKYLSFKCFFHWNIEVQGASKLLVLSEHIRQVELCDLWNPSLCMAPGGGLSLLAELWIWLLHLLENLFCSTTAPLH